MIFFEDKKGNFRMNLDIFQPYSEIGLRIYEKMRCSSLILWTCEDFESSLGSEMFNQIRGMVLRHGQRPGESIFPRVHSVKKLHC